MKIIINADDFGISRTVNSAISKCFQEKIIDRTTLMMNMPYTDEAVKLARQNGFSDKVGLHFNIIEGLPLSKLCESTLLCDSNGYFTGSLHRNLLSRLWVDKKTKKAIIAEAEAQIEKYLAYGFQLMHIDSHQHVHTDLSVYKAIKPLLIKYGFKSIRVSRNIPHTEIHALKRLYKSYLNNSIQNLMYLAGDRIRTKEYMGSLEDFRKSSKEKYNDGNYEIMIHPTLTDKGMLTDNFSKIDIREHLKKDTIANYICATYYLYPRESDNERTYFESVRNRRCNYEDTAY
jgi:predicted glycoside hydrolase/deacetylase ChbG (UPF0249 family)